MTRKILILALGFATFFAFSYLHVNQAYAQTSGAEQAFQISQVPVTTPPGVLFCPAPRCEDLQLATLINVSTQSIRTEIINQHFATRRHVTAEFIQHQNWLVNDFFRGFILPAMMMMTEQLTTVGMHQVAIIGQFFDAKHQLESQRIFQQLQAEAHRNYHPSEGICDFGTNVRSLAASEQQGQAMAHALSQRAMDRQLLKANSASGGDGAFDLKMRQTQFLETYCDPRDNNNGLRNVCEAVNPERANADIDFTRTVDEKLTLNVNFADGAPPTPDEEDVFALSSYLYGNEAFTFVPEAIMNTVSGQENYLDLRAVVAKRNVAENSYAQIVGMKSAGGANAQAVAPFLKAVVNELNVPTNEINAVLGENPSYYAQMEVLTKKLYQSPSFYSNLYDKPANVARKSAAMQAISLMQDRDMYDSLLRSEMLLSLLLEMELEDMAVEVQNRLNKLDSGGAQAE